MKTFFEWLGVITENEKKVAILGELSRGIKNAIRYYRDEYEYFRNNPDFTRRIEKRLNDIRELLNIPETQGEQYTQLRLHSIINDFIETLRDTEFVPGQLGDFVNALRNELKGDLMKLPKEPTQSPRVPSKTQFSIFGRAI